MEVISINLNRMSEIKVYKALADMANFKVTIKSSIDTTEINTVCALWDLNTLIKNKNFTQISRINQMDSNFGFQEMGMYNYFIFKISSFLKKNNFIILIIFYVILEQNMFLENLPQIIGTLISLIIVWAIYSYLRKKYPMVIYNFINFKSFILHLIKIF